MLGAAMHSPAICFVACLAAAVAGACTGSGTGGGGGGAQMPCDPFNPQCDGNGYCGDASVSDGGDIINFCVSDACGGATGVVCRGPNFCSFRDNACGHISGEVGRCVLNFELHGGPDPCASPRFPTGQAVCGCDGQIYSDTCAAEHAGVDVSSLAANGCPPP